MTKNKSNANRSADANRAERNDALNAGRGFRPLIFLKKRLWATALVALVAVGALGATLKYLETDARRQMADKSFDRNDPNRQSLLNRVNPFLATTATANPSSTPQLSKEYIYAGGRMLAIEDANANAAPPADLAVWRRDANAGTGTWYVQGSAGSQQTFVQWGANIDEPAPGDFDGDGKTDFSVFRPSTGFWYVQKSSDSQLLSYGFGQNGDKIAQADYDGDGRTDVAVLRSGNWYILKSSDNTFYGVTFGYADDKPAGADYDGDGKADIAVWRGSDRTFYVLRSSDGQPATAQVGSQSSDEPVSADYDGDGRADYAVKTGNSWLIRHSSTNQLQPAIVWQQAGDKAVQNDYDGDGKVDIAVWRESNGTWYIRNSSDNSTRTALWGQAGDVPVPAFYRR